MHETFKRILVTTDFSESGDHAIGHAFRLAVDHGAEVILRGEPEERVNCTDTFGSKTYLRRRFLAADIERSYAT